MEDKIFDRIAATLSVLTDEVINANEKVIGHCPKNVDPLFFQIVIVNLLADLYKIMEEAE